MLSSCLVTETGLKCNTLMILGITQLVLNQFKSGLLMLDVICYLISQASSFFVSNKGNLSNCRIIVKPLLWSFSFVALYQLQYKKLFFIQFYHLKFLNLMIKSESLENFFNFSVTLKDFQLIFYYPKTLKVKDF